MFQVAYLPEHGLGFCQNGQKHITKTLYLEAETMANKSQKPAPKSAPKATAKKQSATAKKPVKK
jgi:hypothetical protein